MRNVKAVKVYNLVDSNKTKLQLKLGVLQNREGEVCIPKADTGWRWSFVGTKIPMPVRSMTWFNGFPEDTMLLWLHDNGWALQSVVDMDTGKAKVYNLPANNGDNIPELAKEASAQEAYNAAIPVALENAMKTISEAKDKGYTHCYLSSIKGKIPAEVIQSLLDAGYDIKYQVFHKGYGDWFIEAFWSNPREKGKLFKGGSFDDPIEVTIQDYKNA